jgi:c-di-GMP-binding flagellar brake protein YcgR
MTSGAPTDAEIAILEALAVEGEILASKPQAGVPQFRARLLRVDRQRRVMILERSTDEAANRALLALARVDFLVEWGEWRIGFTAANPAPVSHIGATAIRVDFPDTVTIGRRRISPRFPVPWPPLRCVAYSGAVAVVEGKVTDISQGGIGMLVETGGGSLVPGMVLPACRIERAEREPVLVDLEVRHTATATQPDGQEAYRVGCRFIALSPAAMALVHEYQGGKP